MTHVPLTLETYGSNGGDKRSRGDPSRQRLDCRIHHCRVKGVRGVQAPVGHTVEVQDLLEARDGFVWARDDGQLGRVERGDVEALIEERIERIFGGANREHRARREFADQTPALGYECQRVFERKDTGEAGGDEFADAVPDHRGRFDAVAAQELGQRVFDREQGRLRDLGRGDRARVVAVEDRAQVGADRRREQVGATIDRGAKLRNAEVEVASHAGVLRALSGEHEGDGRYLIARDAAGNALGTLECFGSVAWSCGGNRGADGKVAAALLQRIRDVFEANVRRGAQVRGQFRPRRRQRRFAASGEHEQLRRAVRGACFERRRRFEHDVHVRPAQSKRAHGGSAAGCGDWANRWRLC